MKSLKKELYKYIEKQSEKRKYENLEIENIRVTDSIKHHEITHFGKADVKYTFVLNGYEKEVSNPDMEFVYVNGEWYSHFFS